MAQLISLEGAVGKVKNGMTVMVGGFMGVGAPQEVLDLLAEQDVNDLIYIGNDTGLFGDSVSQLVIKRRLRKVIASHIGTNKETGRQLSAGELEVELIPQGTLAERIRAAGSGLGGILTPTGIGTIVERDKDKVNLGGREFLVEAALSADIALIKAKKADKAGNLVYRRTARNFNPLMAMAAKTVIVQVEQLVEAGEIDPDEVVTPGIFVDFIVVTGREEVAGIG